LIAAGREEEKRGKRFPDRGGPRARQTRERSEVLPQLRRAHRRTEPDAFAFLGTDEEPVWDTCCYGCGWTGNIHPDWPVAGADRDAAR